MSSRKKNKLQVLPSETGSRVDKFLASRLTEYSRSFYKKIIEAGFVTVNGRSIKTSHQLAAGDEVVISLPAAEPRKIEPQDISLNIVFEDDHLIAINKPAGMVVHPGAGNRTGTLVNALLHHCSSLSRLGGDTRPGIVHRLDKNTSGILVAAKTDQAYLKLSRQFQDKSAHREYLALVWGRMEQRQGEIETLLNRSKRDRKIFSVSETGKNAVTMFEVEQEYPDFSLLRLRLKTGRTHQIRIHMNHINHPVFGDPDYHGRGKQLGRLNQQSSKNFIKSILKDFPRQALHA
ncbi:MAG: RluA family pseudouridine synthase, partial [Calditrichia bacterium]